MTWPDVRPVLLMTAKAQEERTFREQFARMWAEYTGLKVAPFDPPSHDGTDPWKWSNG